MFEDFQDGAGEDESGKKRRAMSLGISLLIYGGLAAGLAVVAATASAVLPKEREVPVEFAELPPELEAPPEPEPEPEPPPPPRPKKKAAAPRPAAARQDLGTPKSIPDEQPSEAEGDLAEAGDTGPVDGFTDGGGEDVPAPDVVVEDPDEDESAPRQQRLTVQKPVFKSGCAAPELPLEIRKLLGAETIRIEVRIVVDAEGNVANATVTAGHPSIPEDLILECARAQSFTPAKLPGGPAVPYPYMRRFVFRPQSL